MIRLFLGFFLLAVINAAIAADVNLAWDASTSTNVGGYKFYYGTKSKIYTDSVDVGNVTNYKMTGLNDNTLYFFALKSYDTTRQKESAGYSNEVSTATAGTVPIIVPPPTIAALTLTKIGNLITSSANNSLPVGAVCNTYTDVTLADSGKEALMAYREKDLPTLNGSCAVDASKYFTKGTKGYVGITYSYQGKESTLSNILLVDLSVDTSYVLDKSLPTPKNSLLSVDGAKGILSLQSSFIPAGLVTDCLYSVNGSEPTLIKLLKLGKTQAYCKFEVPNTGVNKVVYSFVRNGSPSLKSQEVIFNFQLKTPANAICN